MSRYTSGLFSVVMCRPIWPRTRLCRTPCHVSLLFRTELLHNENEKCLSPNCFRRLINSYSTPWFSPCYPMLHPFFVLFYFVVFYFIFHYTPYHFFRTLSLVNSTQNKDQDDRYFLLDTLNWWCMVRGF